MPAPVAAAAAVPVVAGSAPNAVAPALGMSIAEGVAPYRAADMTAALGDLGHLAPALSQAAPAPAPSRERDDRLNNDPSYAVPSPRM